jgi:hypothetical protein
MDYRNVGIPFRSDYDHRVLHWNPRATNEPLGAFIAKKGIWREAKFPFIIEMVPKGGLDRLEPQRLTLATYGEAGKNGQAKGKHQAVVIYRRHGIPILCIPG